MVKLRNCWVEKITSFEICKILENFRREFSNDLLNK